jgi:hypothetical protein
MQTTQIALENIRTDGGTQSRAAIDQKTVREYAEAMQDGAQFPPIVVFYDGETYWLADGFHRLKAAEENGALELQCDVRQGTQRDAVLHSVGANGAHGLRRTNADKRRAVLCLLEDEEWVQRSDRWIAEQCGVAASFVGDIRAGVTVVELQSNERTGRDGRTINTANIGRDVPEDRVAAILEQTLAARAYPTPEPSAGSTRVNPTTPEEAKALQKNLHGVAAALEFTDHYSPEALRQIISSEDGKALELKRHAAEVRGLLLEFKTALDAVLE